MKIAVSANGKTKDSFMDQRFGRCRYFVLFDDQTEQVDSIMNPSAYASSSAGPTAVKELVKHKIETVITGSVGEIAKESLQVAGIEIITMEASTVQKAIDLYLRSKSQSVKF